MITIECENLPNMEVQASVNRGGPRMPSVTVIGSQEGGRLAFALTLSLEQASQLCERLFDAVDLLAGEAAEAITATRQ